MINDKVNENQITGSVTFAMHLAMNESSRI